MKHEFDVLVTIGRFQPFHRGHKAIIDAALEKAKEVIVVVGSSTPPATPPPLLCAYSDSSKSPPVS